MAGKFYVCGCEGGTVFRAPAPEIAGDIMADLRVDHRVAQGDDFNAPANDGTRTGYRAFGKRALDLALGLALIPFALPIIGLIAILVRRDDGGAPFFGHTRVGREGAEFRCWKIRTMVPDAETRLAEHLAADPKAAAEWEAEVKLTHDPRITRLGAFLRKTSLDELPQLWNVLKGDMSFVGPRPVPKKELEKYGAFKPSYLAVRPGITGLWQVSGRNEVSYAERVQLDVDYHRNHDLAMDLGILVRTAGVVLRPTGK